MVVFYAVVNLLFYKAVKVCLQTTGL